MGGISISETELTLLRGIGDGADCPRLLLKGSGVKKGTLYTTLQRLERKELLSSKSEYRNPEGRSGWSVYGLRERVYSLTKRGRAVLKLAAVLS